MFAQKDNRPCFHGCNLKRNFAMNLPRASRWARFAENTPFMIRSRFEKHCPTSLQTQNEFNKDELVHVNTGRAISTEKSNRSATSR